MKTVATILIFIIGSVALAHKNHPHPSGKSEIQVNKSEDTSLSLINDLYVRDVKPVFKKSCFDCHSQTPQFPWYHEIPLIGGLIDGDMKEAKEHLDFTNDFPFGGHGNPKEDLEAIADSIRDGSMPPLRYRLMHPKAGLSENERQAILAWITKGQTLIEQH